MHQCSVSYCLVLQLCTAYITFSSQGIKVVQHLEMKSYCHSVMPCLVKACGVKLTWIITKCIFQVLAHLLDMVFYSDEKERVIPLLVNIMHYVVPYLRNHRWGWAACCFVVTQNLKKKANQKSLEVDLLSSHLTSHLTSYVRKELKISMKVEHIKCQMDK